MHKYLLHLQCALILCVWGVSATSSNAEDFILRSIYGAKDQNFIINTLKINTIIREVVALKGQKPDIGFSVVDLNSDGENEYIIGIFDSLYCGSAGCTHMIFQKQNGSWQRIFEATVQRLSLGDRVSNMYWDLMVNGNRVTWKNGAYSQ